MTDEEYAAWLEEHRDEPLTVEAIRIIDEHHGT